MVESDTIAAGLLGPWGEMPEVAVRMPLGQSWFLYSLANVLKKLYPYKVPSQIRGKYAGIWTDFYRLIFDDPHGHVPLAHATKTANNNHNYTWCKGTHTGTDLQDLDVSKVVNLSTTTKGLVTILSHAAHRPRGNPSARLEAARVLRDFVNEAVKGTDSMLLQWTEGGDITQVSVSHNQLDWDDLEFPDRAEIADVWERLLLQDDPVTCLIGSTFSRPRIGDLVAFLYHWKFPKNQTRAATHHAANVIMGQVANILQCRTVSRWRPFSADDAIGKGSKEPEAILALIKSVHVEKRAASLAHYLRSHSDYQVSSMKVRRIMTDDNVIYLGAMGTWVNNDEIFYYGMCFDSSFVPPHKTDIFHIFLPEEQLAMLPPPLVLAHNNIVRGVKVEKSEKVSLKALVANYGRTGMAQQENNKLAKNRTRAFSILEQIKSVDKTFSTLTLGQKSLYSLFCAGDFDPQSLYGKPLQDTIETTIMNTTDAMKAELTGNIKAVTDSIPSLPETSVKKNISYVQGKRMRGKNDLRTKCRVPKPDELRIRKKRERQQRRRIRKKKTLLSTTDKEKQVKKGVNVLYLGRNIRGYDRSDDSHDNANEVWNTILAEHLTGAVAKLLLIMNNRHNPWMNNSYGHQRAEVINVIEQVYNSDSPEFLSAVPKFCYDWGWSEDTDPDEVWEHFCQLDLFRKVGLFTKLRRFLALIFGWPEYDPLWTADLWTGRQLHIWTGEWIEYEQTLPDEAPELAEDIPLYHEAIAEIALQRKLEDLHIQDERGEEREGHGRKMAGRECIRELRKQLKNNYALGVKFLEEDALHVTARLMHAIFQFGVDRYLFTIDEASTESGTVRLKVGKAVRSYIHIVRDVWSVLSDHEVLARCCITQCDEFPQLITGREGHFTDMLFGLAHSYIKHVAWNAEFEASCPHLKLAGLLQENKDDRREFMEDIREDVEGMWYAEHMFLHSTEKKLVRTLKTHLKNSTFQDLIYNRETHSLLAAMKFDIDHPFFEEFLDQLHEITSDMACTRKGCECFFQRLHRIRGQNANGRMSTQRCFFEARHSVDANEAGEGTEADAAVDWPKPQQKYLTLTEQDYRGGRQANTDSVTSHMFDNHSHKIDGRLRPEAFANKKDMNKIKKSSAQSDKLVVTSSSLIKQTWRSKFANTHQSWKSCLLSGGTKYHVFVRKSTETVWSSLGGTQDGALMLGPGRLKRGALNGMWVDFDTDELTVKVIHIYSLTGLGTTESDEFIGMVVEPEPPVDDNDGIYFRCVHPEDFGTLTLLQFMIKRKIPQLGGALSKFCTALQVKPVKLRGCKGVTNKARIIALTAKLFPDAPDTDKCRMASEFNLACESYNKKKPPTGQDDDLLLEAVQGLDAQTRGDFEKLEEHLQDAIVNEKVSAKLKKYKWFREKKDPERWTCDEIKALKPMGVAGIGLCRQLSTTRYNVYHPLAGAETKSTSMAWDNVIIPEQECLENALHWLWERHREAGFDASGKPSTDQVIDALKEQYKMDDDLEEQDKECKAYFKKKGVEAADSNDDEGHEDDTDDSKGSDDDKPGDKTAKKHKAETLKPPPAKKLKLTTAASSSKVAAVCESPKATIAKKDDSTPDWLKKPAKPAAPLKEEITGIKEGIVTKPAKPAASLKEALTGIKEEMVTETNGKKGRGGRGGRGAGRGAGRGK